MYFDCSITVKCDDCDILVHQSEPKQCKNVLSEGNVALVYHSLSEGYGRAGISRLSAAMGTKEMSTRTFIQTANFIYNKMSAFFDDKKSVMRGCVEKLYQKNGK